MKIELNKSCKERILQVILFELIANIIIAISVAKLLDVSLAISSSLSLLSAVTAAVWNYIFNYVFDGVQRRYKFERTFTVRTIHACFFEVGLIVTLLPAVMYLLELSVMESLFFETSLVVFFLPYSVVYNWVYDYLRWEMIGKKAEYLNM